MTTKKAKGTPVPGTENPQQETAVETTDALEVSKDFTDISAVMYQSDNLDEMEVAVVMTSKYFKLEKPGEKFRGVYAGLTEVTVKDESTDELKTLHAVRLINNRQAYVNAGFTLVRQFEDGSISIGQPVEVEYTELRKKTKIYKVSLLG